MKKLLFLFSILMFAFESNAAAGGEGESFDDFDGSVSTILGTTERTTERDLCSLTTPIIIKKSLPLTEFVGESSYYSLTPLGKTDQVIIGKVKNPETPSIFMNSSPLNLTTEEYAGRTSFLFEGETHLSYQSILDKTYEGRVESEQNITLVFGVMRYHAPSESFISDGPVMEEAKNYKLIVFQRNGEQTEEEFAKQFKFKTKS